MDANSVARRGTDGDSVALRRTRRGLWQPSSERPRRVSSPRLTDLQTTGSPLTLWRTVITRRTVFAPLTGERAPGTIGQSRDVGSASTAAALGARPLKRIPIVLACVVAVVTVTACGADDSPSADPAPSRTSGLSTSTSSPSSTETPPAWESKYSPRELDQYREALRRWQEYTAKTHEIYEAGSDTPGALRVFKEYSLAWQGAAAVLADSASRHIRVTVPERPLSTRAISVRLNQDGTGTVEISQCTDYRPVTVLQDGKQIETSRPSHLVTPLVINMTKPAGRDWMVAKTELKDHSSCAR